jgi:hypothetical protein
MCRFQTLARPARYSDLKTLPLIAAMAQTRDGTCRARMRILIFCGSSEGTSSIYTNPQSSQSSISALFNICRFVLKRDIFERPMGADGNYLSLCQPYLRVLQEASLSLSGRASGDNSVIQSFFFCLLTCHKRKTKIDQKPTRPHTTHALAERVHRHSITSHVITFCNHYTTRLDLTPMACSAAFVH